MANRPHFALGLLLASMACEVIGCGSEQRPEKVCPSARAPKAAAAPSSDGMPLDKGIRIDKKGDAQWSSDDDALLQVIALAVSGELPLERVSDGYRVAKSPEGSVLARMGLVTGDIITSINDLPATDPDLLANGYPYLHAKREVAIDIKRGDGTMTFTYKIRRSLARLASQQKDVIEAAGVAADPRIVQKSEASYEIKRALFDELLRDPTGHTARIVPELEDGKPVGFKLFAVRASSVVARLGFHNGDLVKSVNGFPLGDPQATLDAAKKLKSAAKLSVEVERGGKKLTMEYRVVD